jgi:toxin ParE1/3/4
VALKAGGARWRVRWTTTAWKDLEAIAQYIAKDSRYYAVLFVQQAREASRSLAYLPRRGRVVPERGDKQTGELFVMNYRLIYHLSGRDVSILALIHGSRGLLALWRRERRP